MIQEQQNLEEWLGKQQSQQDQLTPAIAERFNATVGSIDHNNQALLGVHWCLCLPDATLDQLGEDGHPKLGGFLPPVSLPRRMWASSEVTFLGDLDNNTQIERVSTVSKITEKNGSSGKLVFVNVEHSTSSNGTELIQENQTIVYREASSKMLPYPTPNVFTTDEWDKTKTIAATPQLLFRYSALTFNTHRIHYDLEYAKAEESYPAQIVHGPLMATMLLRYATKKDRRVTRFSFKGLAAAFAGEKLTLAKRQGNHNQGNNNARHDNVELAILGSDGRPVMQAEAWLD